jgi:hypothetical protein
MSDPLPPASRRVRATLIALAVLAALAIASLPPLVQDPGYHAFADRRPLGPWPHAANVLSNAVFLLVGLAGLRAAARPGPLPARAAWIVTFAGIALVAAGSAWYHRAPSDATLVWDRLPMTIGFTGLAAAILAIPFGDAAARALLPPATVAGVASVVVWQATGDLRPYVWVQFTPLLLIAATLAICPMPRAHRAALFAALLLYLAAKGLEHADHAIWAWSGGTISGHTLKHLAAGAACAALVRLTNPAGVPAGCG